MVAWFWLLALFFPLRAGRDMTTYFLWFRDLFAIEPEFPLLMLFRTPLTPLFYGTCFQIFGEGGIEVILSACLRGKHHRGFRCLARVQPRLGVGSERPGGLKPLAVLVL